MAINGLAGIDNAQKVAPIGRAGRSPDTANYLQQFGIAPVFQNTIATTRLRDQASSDLSSGITSDTGQDGTGPVRGQQINAVAVFASGPQILSRISNLAQLTAYQIVVPTVQRGRIISLLN